MEVEFSIIASLILLSFAGGCKLGDKCETSGKPGVVTLDKQCPYFTSLSGPEMVEHGFCGFLDTFGSTTLICCPTVNQIEQRFQPGDSVIDMCKSFGEKISGNDGNTRIIGGSRSRVGEFPHFAALGYKTFSEMLTFECGGALVSERFVLTAAHCCKNSRKPVIVRLGKTSLDPENKEDLGIPADFDVKKVIVHQNYSASQKYHDIAMIQLNRTVIFTSLIWPACIEPEFHYSKAQTLIIAGFGLTNMNNRKTSDWLMKAEVVEIPFSQCFEIYNETLQGTTPKGLRKGLTTDMICARNLTQHSDTCQGDSGSALQMKVGNVYYVVGITSFGISCNTSLPSFYTRVSKYKGWIENVEGKVSCKYSNGTEVNCETGEVCHVDGVAFGIVTKLKKCSYMDQIRNLPQEEKRKKTLRIRIDRKHVCCPSRVSSRACAAFGRRPEQEKSRSKRIVGGTSAKLGEFPHFAILAYVVDSQLSFDCGGSLISESFVLTAAHCCPKSQPPIIVRLGKTALFSNDTSDLFKPVEIDVKDIIIYPEYNVSKKYNDIALIKMKHAAPFSFNIWPACVDTDSPPAYGSELTIAGFGMYSEKSRDRSTWLMKGTVHEIVLEECKNQFMKEYNKRSERSEAQWESIKGLPSGIIDEMICAKNRAYNKHIDTCKGDSGTALQFRNEKKVYNIYGITSFGLSCHTRLPSFYTRVSSYIDWIEKIVWKESI